MMKINKILSFCLLATIGLASCNNDIDDVSKITQPIDLSANAVVVDLNEAITVDPIVNVTIGGKAIAPVIVTEGYKENIDVTVLGMFPFVLKEVNVPVGNDLVTVDDYSIFTVVRSGETGIKDLSGTYDLAGKTVVVTKIGTGAYYLSNGWGGAVIPLNFAETEPGKLIVAEGKNSYGAHLGHGEITADGFKLYVSLLKYDIKDREKIFVKK